MVAVMDKAMNVAASTAPSLRTVGGGAPGSPFPRRILVAIGPERDADAALSAATAVAAATGAELVLLGIAPVAIPPMDQVTTDADDAYRSEHWPDQQTLDRLTYQRLAGAAAHVPATIRVRTTLDWGSHVGGLLHADRLERPDLIVVTSAHAGVLVRLLNHHRTHRLLRHARVPVLVVAAGR